MVSLCDNYDKMIVASFPGPTQLSVQVRYDFRPISNTASPYNQPYYHSEQPHCHALLIA